MVEAGSQRSHGGRVKSEREVCLASTVQWGLENRTQFEYQRLKLEYEWFGFQTVVTIVPLLFLTLYGKRGIYPRSPYCGYLIPSHFIFFNVDSL